MGNENSSGQHASSNQPSDNQSPTGNQLDIKIFCSDIEDKIKNRIVLNSFYKIINFHRPAQGEFVRK